MALGKNMKVDRLIPLKGDKERSSSKESEKKAESKEEFAHFSKMVRYCDKKGFDFQSKSIL